jgi:hypothetical protein
MGPETHLNAVKMDSANWPEEGTVILSDNQRRGAMNLLATYEVDRRLVALLHLYLFWQVLLGKVDSLVLSFERQEQIAPTGNMR